MNVTLLVCLSIATLLALGTGLIRKVLTWAALAALGLLMLTAWFLILGFQFGIFALVFIYCLHQFTEFFRVASAPR